MEVGPWSPVLLPCGGAGLHPLVCWKGLPELWVDRRHLKSVACLLPGHPGPGAAGDEAASPSLGSWTPPHRPTLASAQLTGFFGALDSVLRYRATVLQAFKDMNRLTVNATVLSTRDVLVLLHKWSLIERDVRLQEDLRAATEKCQVRELLSECPLRGSVSSLTPQACWLPSPPPRAAGVSPPPLSSMSTAAKA